MIEQGIYALREQFWQTRLCVPKPTSVPRPLLVPVKLGTCGKRGKLDGRVNIREPREVREWD